MNLFKRLVISLFPPEITNNSVNPANMFVSFISTKDFFSIINRKIVENYKTNLFDVSLEPLEVQIGRDRRIKLSKQEINNYYAYCSVANINGYTFYNLSNISCCITMASAVLLKDIFQKYDEKIFTNFLFTLYLLPYIFASGIKKFPYDDEKKNYNRLVELTFEFFKATSKKKQKKEIEKIKQDVLSHPSIFFIILELLHTIDNILLLNPEFSLNDQDNTILSWLNRGKKIKSDPFNSTLLEGELQSLDNIFPNDILPKYLFNDMNSFLVVEKIIEEIYDKTTIQEYAKKIKDKELAIEEFISYITDISLFKKGFFVGGKKYISEFFYKNDIQGDIGHDIEEIISEIGENPEGIGKFQVPERIKKESKIMEKLLNFYITMLAGFSSSKSDSFYTRIYHPDLLNAITIHLRSNKQLNGKFWKNYYQLYSTNDQYYRNIYEGIRKNQKKVVLQYQTTDSTLIPKGVIALFQETFVTGLLQEINPRETKLYIKNAVLLKTFKKNFGDDITQLLSKKDTDLIEAIYTDIARLLPTPEIIIHELKNHLNEQDIFNLKENFYTVDFWIWRKILQKLHTTQINTLDASTIIGMTSLLRETCFGILLVLEYLENEKYDHLKSILLKLYTQRILGMDETLAKATQDILLAIKEQYNELLKLRIHLDDNKEFLQIIIKYIRILEKKTPEKINNMTHENILRLKGVLQTISTYNKRNLIPKQQ